MLILKPCKKCIVRPICNEACGKIRKRAKFFNNINTFIAFSTPFLYLTMFGIILYTDKRPAPLIGFIVTFILIYIMLSSLIVPVFVRKQIKKANNKFGENLVTGRSMIVTSNIRPIKGPPPPKPPPKRYTKGI